MARPRLLLWWAVTSLLDPRCLGAPQPSSPICGISCCAVEPSCAEASRVTCDCPQTDTIALRPGDVPASVQELHILKAGVVIIHAAAISSAPLLTRFGLLGVRNVTVEKGGMTLQADSKLTSVRMEDIENVQFKSQAVSGNWEEEASVTLEKVDRLHIETSGFNHASDSLGPRLMLTDINMLSLESNAFNAPVSHMALNAVNMEVCRDQSFGGQMHTTTFHNVTIDQAETECATGFKKQATMSIQSSRINELRRGAFSGQLQKLSINNSDFRTMHEKCMDLQVVDLAVGRLFVDHLSAKGLSVKADDSIHIDDIKIELLGKRALSGLLVKPTLSGFCPPVVISKMEISEVEAGSLAFSECADLSVTELRIHAPVASLCPTERLTRALSAGADSGPLSPTQEALFWQLYERDLCGDHEQPFPQMAGKHRCDLERLAEEEEETDIAHGEKSATLSGEKSAALVSRAQLRPPSRAAANTDSSPPDAPAAQASRREAVSGGSAEALSGSSAEEAVSGSSEAASGSSAEAASGSSAEAASSSPAEALSGSSAEEATSGSSETASSSADHQHRLMLYLALGVVLSLTAVLIAALLALLVHRSRSRRRRRADQPSSAVEEALMVIANRLLSQEEQKGGAGDGGKSQAAAPADCSPPPVYSEHQYETIRPELMLQPLPNHEPLIRFDSYDGNAESFTYNRLMER